MAKQIIKVKNLPRKAAEAGLNSQEFLNHKGKRTLSIRGKRRIITFAYIFVSTLVFLTLVLISASYGNKDLKGFFIFLLILNLLLSPWIARSLQKALISVARCSYCGVMIDLFGVWKCPCGYTSNMHVFNKCRNCKEPFGYIPCPKCKVAIDI